MRLNYVSMAKDTSLKEVMRDVYRLSLTVFPQLWFKQLQLFGFVRLI